MSNTDENKEEKQRGMPVVGTPDWLSETISPLLYSPSAGFWVHHSVFLLENNVVTGIQHVCR